ncbi:MAG: DUF4292 domain-containing protein [Bacteroidetes bacterium]|nr:DUF4292 domain-containing protein [Bacteroidota bacterium]
MVHKRKSIYLYLFIILFLSSCAVTKRVKRRKIKNYDIEKIYSLVKANELNYNSYSIKYSAKIDLNGSKNSVSGVMRIVKDSAIWISVSPGFGVELMRLLVTPDSVKMINRLNSTYFAGDFSYLNKVFKFNLDYFSLQAILTNSFFSYEAQDEKNLIKNLIKNFTSKIDSNNYLLQSLPNNSEKDSNIYKQHVTQQMSISPEEFKISKIFMFDYLQNRSLQIKFSNYIDLNDNKFPQNLNLLFNTKKSKTKIDLRYSKVSVNKRARMPFKISKKYLPIK